MIARVLMQSGRFKAKTPGSRGVILKKIDIGRASMVFSPVQNEEGTAANIFVLPKSLDFDGSGDL
jgi:hypothetical protein